jgi:hypothetical protein
MEKRGGFVYVAGKYNQRCFLSVSFSLSIDVRRNVFLTERSPSLRYSLQGVGNAIEPSLLFTERQQRLTTAILARTFFDDDMYKELAQWWETLFWAL